MTTKTYRIVPAGTRDTYAAGEAANHFETRAEAEAAIASLRALGGEWDHDWDVLEGARRVALWPPGRRRCVPLRGSRLARPR